MPFDQLIGALSNQLQVDVIPHAIQFAIALAPIALAFLLGKIFFPLWVDYVRSYQFADLKYTVLEIILPKETYKSPQAMEIVLNSLHNTSDGSKLKQFWDGETRPWYSLEIISIEGNVKFMIWTEDRRKAGVMSALYSQYPDVEIHEVEDYTRSLIFDPKKIRIWAAEFAFTKPDPYPIKTYVDYGLDKDPKEEFKTDPMLPLIEFLGSVRVNQQVWIQIPIRAHKSDQRKPGTLFTKTDLWKDGAQELVNEIMLRNPETKSARGVTETGFPIIPSLSKGEQEVVMAIERSVSKLAFDCGIRALYIAPVDTFDTPFGVGGCIGNLKQFNYEHLNGFRPNGDKWHPSLEDPWTDFMKFRRNRYARVGLDAYKRRSYFYAPYTCTPMVMNTEELATVYHLPGSVSKTPTMQRVTSKKAQAPINLPV